MRLPLGSRHHQEGHALRARAVRGHSCLQLGMVQSDFLHQQTKQRFVQRIAQHSISIIHSRNWTGRECPLDSDWIFQVASRSWGQFNGHVKDKMKTDLTALTPEVIFHWYLHWLQSVDWKYFFCQYKWWGCARHPARAAPPLGSTVDIEMEI